MFVTAFYHFQQETHIFMQKVSFLIPVGPVPLYSLKFPYFNNHVRKYVKPAFTAIFTIKMRGTLVPFLRPILGVFMGL